MNSCPKTYRSVSKSYLLRITSFETGAGVRCLASFSALTSNTHTPWSLQLLDCLLVLSPQTPTAWAARPPPLALSVRSNATSTKQIRSRHRKEKRATLCFPAKCQSFSAPRLTAPGHIGRGSVLSLLSFASLCLSPCLSVSISPRTRAYSQRRQCAQVRTEKLQYLERLTVFKVGYC